MARRRFDSLSLLLAAGVLAGPAWTAGQEPAAPPPLPGPTSAVNYPLREPAPARNDNVVPASNSTPSISTTITAVPTAPPPGPVTPTGGASISLETVGPLTVPSGQPLPFEVVVRNAWTRTATQVRLELPVPPGARFLAGAPAPEILNDRVIWTVGNLEPGAERRFKGDMQPAPDGDLVLSPSVSYAAAGGLRARVVRPPFSVTLTGPETAQRGQPATFRLQVANAGPERLREVVARVTLPDGVRHPAGAEIEADVGELAPGQSRSLNLEVVPSCAGPFVLEASAQAHQGQRAQGRAVVVVSDNTLALRLEGPALSGVGEDVDIRLEVANPGTVSVSRARLRLQLPEGLEFVSASGGGTFNPSLRAVAWTLPALPAGSGAPLAVQTRPREPGQWTVQAVAVAEGYPEARGDWTVRACNTVRADAALRTAEVPDLVLEMFGPSQGIQVGQEGTLEIRLVNKGTASGANVRLGAQVPEILGPVRAEGPTAVCIDGQRVVFDPVAQLVAGAEAVYRIRVRGIRAGHGLLVTNVNAHFLLKPLVEQLNTRVIDGP